jgi:hypothetical protein
MTATISGDGTSTLINLTTSGNTILGDASTDTLNVGNGGLVKDASGNVGIGTTTIAGRLSLGSLAANRVLAVYDDSTNWYGLGISAANFQVNAPSAASITFNGYTRSTDTLTERMRIDSNGVLGIGITPSASWSSTLVKALQIGDTGASVSGYTSFNTGGKTAFLTTNAVYEGVSGSGWKYMGSGAASQYALANDTHYWNIVASGTAGNAITWTQAMTLTSGGNLLVGTTSGSARLYITADGAVLDPLTIHNTSTSANSQYSILFVRNGTIRGSIQTTNTATSYLTSSDYRLKENVQPMTGALDKVAALKPCTYVWKDGSADGQGFIAHELQEVVPDAVSGEKDAVNEDGSIKAQGIDTSFLVATLTAAIQELKALVDTQASTITQLQADVAVLKGTP